MEHQGQLAGLAGFRNIGFSDKVRRCLDRATHSGIVFESACWGDVAELIAEARQIIELAPDETIKRLFDHNSDILRLARYAFEGGERKALFAYLPLNEEGVCALAEGRFDGRNPDPRWICRAGVTPEAIYLWLVFMPGSLAQSIGVIAKGFDELAPRGCPVFSRAVNPHAERLNRAMGFLNASEFYPDCQPGLLVIFPQKEAESISRKRLSVKPAREIGDMMQVFSIRAATYIAEQFCLYDEEFDGNDFCATHFLGSVDGDPAGCIRVRYFAGFAKIERLAVRVEYRNSRLAFELVRAAIDHCRRKGFSKLYGHSRLDLVRFWRIFGFREREDRGEFAFANVRYVELVLDQEALPDAISLDDDPMVLIRPEGAWDRPGPLDRSRCEADPRRRSMMADKTRTLRGKTIAR